MNPHLQFMFDHIKYTKVVCVPGIIVEDGCRLGAYAYIYNILNMHISYTVSYKCIVYTEYSINIISMKSIFMLQISMGEIPSNSILMHSYQVLDSQTV